MRVQGPMVRTVNKWIVGLRHAPVVGKLVRKSLTVVTYTGRRSGRTISTPVGYQRKGDVVEIRVMMPDAKVWWRNFEDAGGPLTLELDGAERTGHATSHRDDKGRVTVRVQL
ncbi:nitroreductase/quinone reductase family protein [Lentzea sp. BCCO 10_0061]|uniref:Nitroreductase/quinone reductase family protein n=2 Tax=Lentzea sokolovensis TaxID=3095429 RepID=A0ABU4UT90_9PSEU|nr:nitroreductase/quinone reductase family protein [Lentzea sp. BCCO 10_0061]MDX8142718.1 nitroreductase/quinone reductase family protein [Lentzea sp. BCCO 10_0061]